MRLAKSDLAKVEEHLAALQVMKAELMLDALKHLKNTTIRDLGEGICGHIQRYVWTEFRKRKYRHTTDPGTMLRNLFSSWEKYSGDAHYPVEGGSRAYRRARSKNMIWSSRTDYGKLRHELLDHCIAQLKASYANAYVRTEGAK